MKRLLLVLIFLVITAQSPIEVVVNKSGQASGLVFLAQAQQNGRLLIIDNSGHLLFDRPMPNGILDFRPLGDGRLVYYNRRPVNTREFLDDQYQIVDTLEATAPFQGETDGHELLMTPSGGYIYFVYDEIQPFDLSPYGGPVTATVVSTVIQEIDQDRNVIFQWRDFDHLDLADSNENLTVGRVDPFHGNSIEVDHDGHLIVSLRGSDEILKIDRQTGSVIWRLGGKNNQFIVNGEIFSRQHDARRLDNGNLTIFDNRGGDYSRAVEYRMNEATLTITQTWAITGPFASCCGNAQRLPNGNTLVNWGRSGRISETTPAGQIVWSAVISPGFTYRAFRQEWPGYRVWLPAVGK